MVDPLCDSILVTGSVTSFYICVHGFGNLSYFSQDSHMPHSIFSYEFHGNHYSHYWLFSCPMCLKLLVNDSLCAHATCTWTLFLLFCCFFFFFKWIQSRTSPSEDNNTLDFFFPLKWRFWYMVYYSLDIVFLYILNMCFLNLKCFVLNFTMTYTCNLI